MATPSGLENALRELARFTPTTMPVLSAYLNAKPDQHGRDNFWPFLRKELRARAAAYPLGSPERQSFDRDAKRITSWLETKLRPSSNGAAVFACSGVGDFFEALQFDAPFCLNRLHVYHRPHLYSLAHLYDRHRSYAAVIADTNAARIFVFGPGAHPRCVESNGRFSSVRRGDHFVVGIWFASQIPEVLASVIQIDDLNRAWKIRFERFQIHSVPSPITTLFSARLQPRFQASR